MIRVFENSRELARGAAEHWVALAPFTVALSGGSTPKVLYQLLAEEFREQIPWTNAHFYWSDERHVPPDHPESNYRMAQDSLLSRIPVRGDRVHRVRAEQPDAAVAAIAYEVDVRRTFDCYGAVPRFDLILLDLRLPDGDGCDFVPGLVPPGEPEPTRVIAVSAHALAADRARAIEVGCCAFIEKPIDVTTFAERIEKIAHAPA